MAPSSRRPTTLSELLKLQKLLEGGTKLTHHCPTWTVAPGPEAAFSHAKAERDAIFASGHIFRGKPGWKKFKIKPYFPKNVD